MPRQNAIQTAWTKGEVSPLAAGRADVNLYANGAKTIENLIVRPQGPLFRRSGTRFVRETKIPTATKTRIIPFTVSDETAYVLEFGANDGTAILDIDPNAGLFEIETSSAHGLLTGAYVNIYGVTNYSGANGTWQITKVSNTKFTLNGSVHSGSGAVDGYWSPYPQGYIHIYKDKEPLLETTTTEIEAFTVDSSGGLIRITATYDDLPAWGDLAALGGGANNGDITISQGVGSLVRITTTVPHTLRTGALVLMLSTELAGINATQYTVTRISEYAVDLQGSTYGAPGAGNTAMYSHGLIAGDRVYFSGGAEHPELTEQYLTVSSVPSYDKFVVANVAYINATTPTNEEVHCIPIEIVTAYNAEDLENLRFIQSNDVLYIFHPNHVTRKLVRLDTDGDRGDWLLADIDFQDGPYLPLNSLAPTLDTTTPANGTIFKDVYFEVSSYSHTATVKSASDFTDATDDDGSHYLEYRVADEWKLAKIQSASVSGSDLRTATVDIIDNVLLTLDEAVRLKDKKSKQDTVPGSSTSSQVTVRGTSKYNGVIDPRNHVASSVATASIPTNVGTLTSQFSNTFSQQDVGKFIRVVTSDAIGAASGPAPYWVQITKITGTSGTTAAHSQSVTMATNNATGNFVITNESRTATLIAYRANATYAAFALTDVGRLVRLGFAGRWTWGKITAYTSTSQVTITLYEDMPRDPRNAANIAGAVTPSATYSGASAAATRLSGVTTGRTYDWRLGAWSATTGYPTCGVFHEQRLWLANTITQPQTFWGSASGDFENMAPTELDSTVLDDNAIVYTLGSTQANTIKWMMSGPAMHIGTSGGEWQVRASSSAQDALSPSNLKATEYTSHGSGAARPHRIGSSVVFPDRSGEKVHEIFYAYEQDAVDSDDLTVISEHILRDHGGAVQSAFQQKPHSILWIVCGDGTLAAMTFNKKQEVVAWHHHTIAEGTVKDICVIPSTDASEDEVWLVVGRTISGTTHYNIEVLESDYYPTSASARTGMRFLDCHKVISGFASTAITGLNAWEGLSVTVVRDGTKDTGTKTVTSGAITLDGTGTEVVIGILGSCYVQSLPPEGGSQFGTSQGQTKRIVYLDCRFLSTGNVSVGPSTSSLIARTLPTNPNWFTGTERLVPAHGYDEESAWVISQPEPYPLNILFVVTKLETNE